MPKLGCPCGYAHNLSPIPDEGWITIRDDQYDALIEAERTSGAAEKLHHLRTSEQNKALQDADNAFMNSTGRLYECPKCGSIMWEKPTDEVFKVFRPES